MADYMYKRKDANLCETINHLIYDYLIKMNFEGTAKSFMVEADIKGFQPTEGPSTLYQWYSAFNDISTVRCGLSSNPQDLSRIEGIMLKLENEKKRYMHMGRVEPHISPFGLQTELESFKQHAPMNFPPNYFDQRKGPEMFSQSTNMSPMDPNQQFFDGRRGPGIYGNVPGPQRLNPRNEEAVPPMKSPRQKRPEEMGYPPNLSMKPGANGDKMEVMGPGDKNYVLREAMSLRQLEAPVVCTAVAKDHKVLIVATNEKKIHIINVQTGKTEAVQDTNGNQVTKIKIKEYVEQVIMACDTDNNKILLMRCILRGEPRLELINQIRGISTEIVAFEILNHIYVLANNGIMRKYNIQGGFEREEVMSTGILHICAVSDTNFLLADKERVYIYDFEMNLELLDVLKGSVVEIKRTSPGFLIIMREQVVWLNNNMDKIKSLKVSGDSARTATVLDGEIVVANHQDAVYETTGGLNRTKLHDSNIVGLDTVNSFRGPAILSTSGHGECKIWTKYPNE